MGPTWPFLLMYGSHDLRLTGFRRLTVVNGTPWEMGRHTIHGLKQASRSWNIQFNETIKEFDISQNVDEACVYKKVSGSAVIFLAFYVDDILIIGNDVSKKQSVNIYWLSKNILNERPWRSGLHIGDIDI